MILITTSIYGQSRRDIDCRNDKCAEMTELTIKNKYSNLNVYVNNSLIENDSLVLFCLPLASKYQIKAEINGNRAFFEKGKMINCKESVEIEIKEPYRKSHKWLLFGGILGATASSIVSFSSYNTFGMDESVIMGIYYLGN